MLAGLLLLVRGRGGIGSVAFGLFREDGRFCAGFLVSSCCACPLKSQGELCKNSKKFKLSLHKFYSGTSTKLGALKNAIINNIDAINATSLVSIIKRSSSISLLLWLNIICIPNKLIKITPAPK